MSQSELRIGIVGCGGISNTHVRSYQQLGGNHITQVFDVHRPNAEKMAEKTGASITESLERMAKSGGLDAVSVCTPPGTHLECCLPFLEAGVPILCEKPFEIRPVRTALLEAAVRQSRSLFMIAYCHRFYPAVLEVKRLLTEEKELVGDPIFFRNFFGGHLDMSSGHRVSPKLSGGGVLIDNGSHSLDLFRFLMGEVETICAQTDNLVQDGQVEDFATLDVRGCNKTAGQISGSYSLPVPYNTVEIFCSNSTLTINYWLPDRADLVVRIKGEAADRQLNFKGSPDRYTAEIQHFMQCVREGRQPSPGIDDAVLSACLVEAAYRSAREGACVRL